MVTLRTTDTPHPVGVRWRISRRARKAILVAHLMSAIGWIGADIGLLVLGIVALTDSAPRVGQSACVAMSFLATWISAPFSVLALLSGILLSLATKWGLFRYAWVMVSLVLNLIMAALVTIALAPMLRGFADQVLAAPASAAVADTLGPRAVALITPPCVAFVLLTFVTVINVYKPWGRR
jgi:hypothetical protein